LFRFARDRAVLYDTCDLQQTTSTLEDEQFRGIWSATRAQHTWAVCAERCSQRRPPILPYRAPADQIESQIGHEGRLRLADQSTTVRVGVLCNSLVGFVGISSMTAPGVGSDCAEIDRTCRGSLCLQCRRTLTIQKPLLLLMWFESPTFTIRPLSSLLSFAS
jgi:hypothetical protein